jgi:hypothetical protein
MMPTEGNGGVAGWSSKADDGAIGGAMNPGGGALIQAAVRQIELAAH